MITNIKDFQKSILEKSKNIKPNITINETKEYYLQDNIGKVKYSVSYYNGKKKNTDGSKFYDFKPFSNKKKRDDFVKELEEKGYVKRGINLSNVKENKINEEAGKISTISFYIKSAEVRIHKDSFTEGETDFVNAYDVDFNTEYDDVEDYFSDLSRTFPGIDFKLNNLIVFDNRLIYSTNVDENDDEITLSEESPDGFTIDIDAHVSVYKKELITDSQEISKVLNVPNYD